MRKEKQQAAVIHPVLFLDDWPQPPRCSEEDEFENPGLTDVKKWRFQTLLAVNPWGIPSLAFSDAYEKMFGKPLDIRDLGFEYLSDMVCKLTDIFKIQEPDEITAMMFPEYSQDRILHDARLPHDFDVPFIDAEVDYKTTDPDTLIAYAWVNRDGEFPPDVVLAGEHYAELILPMTTANVPGTRGVHKAVMVGAASPSHFYINIKDGSMERLDGLSDEISLYFKDCGPLIDNYSVPEEFIYPGFPCLVYIPTEQTWERCAIVGKSPKGNKVLIETVDYGGIRTVDQIYLYLMPRKFFDMPKQGVLVSMTGLRPADGTDKWSNSAGSRTRCFSNEKYWLDCLLIEPNDFRSSESSSIGGETTSSNSSGLDVGTKSKNGTTAQKRRKKSSQKPQFEVLVCDRNDDEMDIYLDEILVLETYAIFDDSRSGQIEIYRGHFKNALKTVPRPENSLI